MIKILQMEIVLLMYTIVAKKDEHGSWSPMDAKIKEFFVYEYETGKVAHGGKHDWSQVGSQEYVDITGRY